MSLDVYLRGNRVGKLAPTGENTYSFAYGPEALSASKEKATLALSHSLPLRPEPFGPDASRAYVEGLLPQGARREAIAAELGLDPGDGYGLIAELGADCLGAVVFRPEGAAEEAPPAEPVWLDEDELEEAVRWSPRGYFDADRPQRMRFALPGERHKLALVRDERNDRWGWPQAGIPSTHIVKPESPERPGFVATEHACALAYRELGFLVAHTEIATIAGQTCLVSKRFDRWGEWPQVDRLHQESFAQALAIPPEEDGEGRLLAGTPSLAEASGLLRAIGEGHAVEALMRATFCDLLIGCARPRGGGGLLYGIEGRPMLAPLCDVASTEIYGEARPHPAMAADDLLPVPLLVHLHHTIELCGAEFQPALIESVRLMGEVCVALGDVAAAAWEEGWHRRAIEEALQTATSRALGFREEAAYLGPPGGEPPV